VRKHFLIEQGMNWFPPKDPERPSCQENPVYEAPANDHEQTNTMGRVVWGSCQKPCVYDHFLKIMVIWKGGLGMLVLDVRHKVSIQYGTLMVKAMDGVIDTIAEMFRMLMEVGLITLVERMEYPTGLS
jgi:hypothetical protein